MTAITKEMGIMEVVERWPQVAQVLMEYGMGCIGCAAAHFESIEEGALAHGIDISALIQALNQSIESNS